MRIIGVIPARYQSSRLEGKVLADIHGKPMVQHVYERARRASCLDDVVVATDDQRIRSAVESFGGKAVMTSADHRSGTDRVAEAVRGMDADAIVNIIVNIQGDEPMLDPAMLAEVVDPFRSGVRADVVTLKKRVLHEREFADPGVVKVVTDPAGYALYFSRSLIPYPRQRTPRFAVFEHLGLYAYTRGALMRLAELPPSDLEEIESLEQLRALENGIRILVIETASRQEMLSVDTQADLERARELMGAVNV
ncbi:MAG TPA: 3-deoxy-manno-octulosonate cytidylyltransferase [Candidatus Acidoferrales bacterium]|jgi:3-deoxy-manno-octulosonate cytidylyltransferase (CMP-KDO synthetase)|nr:3-deoxy-manno-octulosonate cytidylyltransferase [Candidatus Acidoferrales bacterium]